MPPSCSATEELAACSAHRNDLGAMLYDMAGDAPGGVFLAKKDGSRGVEPREDPPA